MFSNAIKYLPLTDALADSLFTNINADSFESDSSFCATLRALLYNRLQITDSISVKLESSYKNEPDGNI